MKKLLALAVFTTSFAGANALAASSADFAAKVILAGNPGKASNPVQASSLSQKTIAIGNLPAANSVTPSFVDK